MASGTSKVAVTLIRNSQNQLLLVYSETWGGYTLPMTKLKEARDGGPQSGLETEEWVNAAARNVVECLGRPAIPVEVLKTPVAEAHFSQRLQKVRSYTFHVFEERFRESGVAADRVTAKSPHVWATPQQILKWEIRPLTHTAHDLVAYNEIITFLNSSQSDS